MGILFPVTSLRDIWTKIMEHKENGFAVCINNDEYPASLELHKIYRIIPDADVQEDGDLRVIDESSEDYLYPAEWFVLITLPYEVDKLLQNVNF
jgi:hypothetical protein